MNEKELTEVLGRLRGEADAPNHRTSLRRALLVEQKSMTRFAALQYLVTLSKMKKYYIPLAAVALVVVGAATFNPGDPAVAQAQEQAQRAYTRAIEISPEMRAQLEEKMKSDMLATLKEAMAAPDLRILTKEEFEKESPFTFSKGPMPANLPSDVVTDVQTVAFSGSAHAVAGTRVDMPKDGATFTVSAEAPKNGTASMNAAFVGHAGGPGEFSEPVKYLSYTDPRGNKTVLGLDKNDTPVFKFATLSAGEVMHFEDGSVGVQGKAIKMINLERVNTAE